MAVDNQSPVPEPTADQQRVLDRIAKQRERIRARRIARAQSVALAQQRSTQQHNSVLDESFALRAADFAKQHPVAVAALVGVAVVAGPGRLIRWAGLAMPIISRLRPFLARRA